MSDRRWGGDGATGDVHHRGGLFLFITHAIDEDDCHPFALGQASDRGRDVDRDRRVDWDEGPDRLLRLIAPLPAQVLESPPSRNSAQPGFQFGLVSKLVPVLLTMEKRLLGDVFGAVASPERTAKGREVGEVLVVVVVKSVPYPTSTLAPFTCLRGVELPETLTSSPKQTALVRTKHYATCNPAGHGSGGWATAGAVSARSASGPLNDQ